LKENSFWNKNWIFKYTKALEICTRRFRRNFDVGFFLNSSRLFKDFREIKYTIPCNASYVRLFLEGFSYPRQIDMQPICTSILTKFYSCKMWVLYGRGEVPRGNAPPPPPHALVSLELLLATQNDLMRLIVENEMGHVAECLQL
jgi:hypothetical protein